MSMGQYNAKINVTRCKHNTEIHISNNASRVKSQNYYCFFCLHFIWNFLLNVIHHNMNHNYGAYR